MSRHTPQDNSALTAIDTIIDAVNQVQGLVAQTQHHPGIESSDLVGFLRTAHALCGQTALLLHDMKTEATKVAIPSQQSTTSPLLTLPYEVLKEIFGLLELQHLKPLRCTCKSLASDLSPRLFGSIKCHGFQMSDAISLRLLPHLYSSRVGPLIRTIRLTHAMDVYPDNPLAPFAILGLQAQTSLAGVENFRLKNFSFASKANNRLASTMLGAMTGLTSVSLKRVDLNKIMTLSHPLRITLPRLEHLRLEGAHGAISHYQRLLSKADNEIKCLVSLAWIRCTILADDGSHKDITRHALPNLLEKAGNIPSLKACLLGVTKHHRALAEQAFQSAFGDRTGGAYEVRGHLNTYSWTKPGCPEHERLACINA